MLDRTHSIEDAIAAAPLLMEPFPHIIVPDVLPVEVISAVIERWPPEERMAPEPGGIGRFMFPIYDNRTLRSRFGTWRRRWRLRDGYLAQFGTSHGKAVIDAALARFADFNRTRFGERARYWGNLCLFDS